jgi:hypothetical protein
MQRVTDQVILACVESYALRILSIPFLDILAIFCLLDDGRLSGFLSTTASFTS